MRSLAAHMCACAALCGVAVFAQDAPPVVAMEIPMSTPNGDKTLQLFEGEDVKAAISTFCAAEGLDADTDGAQIMQFVVGKARKPALSLPIRTANGDRVLDLYEGNDIQAEVAAFCNREGLSETGRNQILTEIVNRGRPQVYAMTVPVSLGTDKDDPAGERVLHLYDGDKVAEKVLEFCQETGLGQPAYDSIVEFVKKRAESKPLMSIPFDTKKGSQTLKIYPEDIVINACRYFVHALDLGQPELEAVASQVENQIALLQRDQYNNILDTGSAVFAGLDADSSGALTSSEWGLLTAGDDSPIDFNGDSAVDFKEFMAARSGSLAALAVSASGAMDDLLGKIIAKHASNGASSSAVTVDTLSAVFVGELLQGDAGPVLKALDADASGALNYTEMRSMRGALISRHVANNAFSKSLAAFKAADANSDGLLSASESSGLVSSFFGPDVPSAFAVMDEGSDGSVSVSEFMSATMSLPVLHAVKNYSAGAVQPAANGGALFTGRGSELVVDAELALFRKFDADTDGILDAAEQAKFEGEELKPGGFSGTVGQLAGVGAGEGVTQAQFRDAVLAPAGRGQAFVAACNGLVRSLVESSLKGVHALTPNVFQAVKAAAAAEGGAAPAQQDAAVVALFASVLA